MSYKTMIQPRTSNVVLSAFIGEALAFGVVVVIMSYLAVEFVHAWIG